MRRQRGFSLIELLVAIGIFMILIAAVFWMLDLSQQRYKADAELMDSFQGARLSMDQMTRDIHMAGYPPPNQYTAAVVAANPQLPATPFAWSPNYPAAPCTVNATCSAIGGPSAFDLILEADINPEARDGVEWIRYRLNGTVLERGMTTKIAGADPEITTRAVMVPYIENVINNTTVAQMNFLQQSFPALFPGDAPVPLFTYAFNPGGNVPANIREVNITIIVLAPNLDPKTRQPRVVTLNGRARRFNP
jgi:prepilin-type N-terminal cleavage/methylation domain-containing protein